jgi:hypothetical protein
MNLLVVLVLLFKAFKPTVDGLDHRLLNPNPNPNPNPNLFQDHALLEVLQHPNVSLVAKVDTLKRKKLYTLFAFRNLHFHEHDF